MLVSAHQSDQVSLRRILRRSAWKLVVRSSWSEALDQLRRNPVPVVICDAELAESNWRLLLEGLAALPQQPSLIVSSRLADERLWAEVLNLGGYDVLPTPFDADEVYRVSFQAWQYRERRREESGELLLEEAAS
jgi:DNA-binding NtrC family response regulator